MSPVHLIRRPRHILSDPPNKLSSDLDRLLAAQADLSSNPTPDIERHSTWQIESQPTVTAPPPGDTAQIS